MTISHHPPDELLADFATGRLDEADHLVVAVHVAQCPACRRFAGAMEHLAGAALEETAPVAMKADAFAAIMAKLDEPQPAPREDAQPPAELPDEDLPEILRRCRFGKQRRVAPGLKLQPIILPSAKQSRAFLLWSAPGARMLQHSHSGTELTCVLKGSFSHEAGRYGPGDFDFGDGEVDHQPVVGPEEPCLCLVAMTGDLELHGLLGRLISPFVRL
ncbi:ChrR family anti-sigma-E factor [Bradyrhizobium betae]|uniref:Transcriptional regulator n=1 Tax=Bradyrhizobium betae TaxID=244734 RepID=A0A5P6P0U6_9BRAD|nr:ChrR family anti-sigma-E factor [Bradyrhizobium betae]MCS3728204.1 putative transcriptional regulator [Bradyrhizobium betae]QFI71806.1 transcriptional regulator [Bradyrhizobium betae]